MRARIRWSSRASASRGPSSGLGSGGQSPIGDEESWNLVSCIVKSNDDLRQEVCALQIIAACDDAFRAAGLAGDRTGLWLKHYSIVPTGASTGIVEVMTDAVSLDSLKKSKGLRTWRPI